MEPYMFLLLDAAGRIYQFTTHRCSTDEDALTYASSFLAGLYSDVEVWNRTGAIGIVAGPAIVVSPFGWRP